VFDRANLDSKPGENFLDCMCTFLLSLEPLMCHESGFGDTRKGSVLIEALFHTCLCHLRNIMSPACTANNLWVYRVGNCEVRLGILARFTHLLQNNSQNLPEPRK